MSPLRREDPGPRRERTAEERERDRREREARRAGGRGAAGGASADAPAVAPSEYEAPPEPRAPFEPPPAQRAPAPALAPEREAPLESQAPLKAPPEPEAPFVSHAPVPPAEPEAPSQPPPVPRPPAPPAEPDRPFESPAAYRAPSDHDPSVRRIQPDPPAPPAAPAGALNDETEKPLGVRWAGRLSSNRPVVTPPADVPRGPVRSRRRPGPRILAIIGLLIAAALALGVVKFFQPFAGDPGAPVRVEIPPGSSVGEIGDQLAAAKVVDSSLIFNVRATLAGKRGALRSGSYELRRNMTYGAAIDALGATSAASKGDTVDVTVPEGRSRREIVPIVRKAGLKGDYLIASRRFAGALNPFRYDAPRGTRSLEGFLFPSTYELRRGASARDLVERQLVAFKKNFRAVNLRRAHRRKLTAYDVLIIASMVEREAGVARERRLVAAVIYNRLRDGGPIGIDASIRYVLRKPSGELTKSDLEIDSPYNSRKRAGLPPTPIGNPGLASIRAAANPAAVRYRYFVVKPGTCSHAFSTTAKQFKRDFTRYDSARRQLGKSPTTC